VYTDIDKVAGSGGHSAIETTGKAPLRLSLRMQGTRLTQSDRIEGVGDVKHASD
jgi:hypothetical protein